MEGRALMKKTFTHLLFICFTSYSLFANAADCVETCESYRTSYTWERTDENMKKVASGMVSWGLFMAAFTMVLTGLIPSNPSDNPTTTTTTTTTN